MGLLVPIGAAKMVFYGLTLWNAFKALKVTKTRNKIPRPVIRRGQPPNVIQTPPSQDPLTAAQKTRRTRIKEMTKVCLVWVVWSYFKGFLDWVAWAIPFYDELHFLFLVWLITLGPSAADAVFRHGIKRIATPYEKSLDSILGTTHDVLQVTMYLATSGPRYLNLQWQKWKARQFNKSLLSTRSVAPPTRLPSLNMYHANQFQRQASSLDLESSFRNGTSTQHPAPPQSACSAPAPSTNNSSRYLFVPERKPTLSRKLSAGYKRSVSHSRPKSLDELSSFYPRNISTDRLIARPHLRPYPPLGSANLNIQRDPQSIHFRRDSVQSDFNMPPSSNHPSCRTEDGESENNSIIVHEDQPMPFHEPEPVSGLIDSPRSDHPSKTVHLPQKRTRNSADDTAAATRRKKKAGAVPSSTKRQDLTLNSELSNPPSKPSTIERRTGLRVKGGSQNGTTVGSTLQTENKDDDPAQDEPEMRDDLKLPERPTVERSPVAAEESSVWHQSSNAALPLPDQTLSPRQVPAPTVRRRLHNPDEPLPVQHAVSQASRMREQALGSVRSLEASSELPSADRTRWQSRKLSPGHLRSNGDSHTGSVGSRAETKAKKLARSPGGNQKRRVSSIAKKREISGKLGQDRAATMMAQKKTLGSSQMRRGLQQSVDVARRSQANGLASEHSVTSRLESHPAPKLCPS